jgi:hypothetical protein
MERTGQDCKVFLLHTVIVGTWDAVAGRLCKECLVEREEHFLTYYSHIKKIYGEKFPKIAKITKTCP